MHQHRYAHRTIACDIELQLLPIAGRGEVPYCTIRRNDSAVGELLAVLNGKTIMESGDSVVVSSRGTDVFSIDQAERLVTVAFVDRYPADRVEAMVLNWVMPHVLTVFGELVLHATASRIDDEIVGFAGETGMGKSTLAVSLALAGYPLVADDTLVIEDRGVRPVVIPSYPGTRLRSGSLSHFGFESTHSPTWPAAVDPERLSFSQEKANLRSIMLLEPVNFDDAVQVRQPTPFDLARLIDQLYILPSSISDSADRATSLLERGLVRILAVPRSLARLPEVIEVLVAET
jgi:hypothetical protein